MEIKKIQFRQSGGFAGLVRGSETSADDISIAQRRALERLAKSTRSASPPEVSRARDMVMYELELDTDAGKVRLEFDEASVPDGLAPLVDELAKRARPVRP